MDLNAINLNVNRLLSNIWAVITFLKEFSVDEAKDVSITYINSDGSESVKTFSNIAKMVQNLEEWKNSFSIDSVEYSTNGLPKNVSQPTVNEYFDLTDAKITIPKSGKWMVTYTVRMWQNTSTTSFWKAHQMIKNSQEIPQSKILAFNKKELHLNADSTHSMSFIVDAIKDDILQLQGFWSNYAHGNTYYGNEVGGTTIVAIRLGA